MSTLKIFSQSIEMHDNGCSLIGDEIVKDSTVNLFISTGTKCNARCKFCITHSGEEHSAPDIDKLSMVLDELLSKNALYSISITGGEPTLDLSQLSRIIKTIRDKSKTIRIKLNTNGINLEKLLLCNMHYHINEVHISRHHYIDKINDTIFGDRQLGSGDLHRLIYSLNSSDVKAVINCCAIQGFISGEYEITKMADYSRGLGCKHLGITDLIPLTEYSTNQSTDSREAVEKISKKLNKTQLIHNSEGCTCLRAQYLAPNGLITIYHRQSIPTQEKKCTSLVFKENGLYNGFDNHTRIV